MEMLVHLYDTYVVNVLDILIISFVVYKIILTIRGTRAMQIVAGILFLLIFTIISQKILHLRAVSWLLNGFWLTGVLILAIAFQTEIRNMLARVGGNLWFVSSSHVRNTDIEEIVEAAQEMTTTSTGALIAIENEIGLRSYTENGVLLNADISRELLLSIFKNKNSPLHDGAAIIYNNKIIAANCVLPLSNNARLKLFGTRHRAALGLSEATDAVIIVVSEESGTMSIAYKGKLHRDMSEIEVKEILVTKGKVLEKQ
jgi:diadenylate cyclase